MWTSVRIVALVKAVYALNQHRHIDEEGNKIGTLQVNHGQGQHVRIEDESTSSGSSTFTALAHHLSNAYHHAAHIATRGSSFMDLTRNVPAVHLAQAFYQPDDTTHAIKKLETTDHDDSSPTRDYTGGRWIVSGNVDDVYSFYKNVEDEDGVFKVRDAHGHQFTMHEDKLDSSPWTNWRNWNELKDIDSIPMLYASFLCSYDALTQPFVQFDGDVSEFMSNLHEKGDVSNGVYVVSASMSDSKWFEGTPMLPGDIKYYVFERDAEHNLVPMFADKRQNIYPMLGKQNDNLVPRAVEEQVDARGLVLVPQVESVTWNSVLDFADVLVVDKLIEPKGIFEHGMSERQVRHVLLQILVAVAPIHEKGKALLSIQPSNLQLTLNDDANPLQFSGLDFVSDADARVNIFEESDGSLSHPGTAAYMPFADFDLAARDDGLPQRRPSALACDLWAIAVTAVELLIGKKCYARHGGKAGPVDVSNSIHEEWSDNFSEFQRHLGDKVSSNFKSFFLKAFHQNAKERFLSVSEMISFLTGDYFAERNVSPRAHGVIEFKNQIDQMMIKGDKFSNSRKFEDLPGLAELDNVEELTKKSKSEVLQLIAVPLAELRKVEEQQQAAGSREHQQVIDDATAALERLTEFVLVEWRLSSEVEHKLASVNSVWHGLLHQQRGSWQFGC